MNGDITLEALRRCQRGRNIKTVTADTKWRKG